MLFGHLAISALLHRSLKADLAPTVVAGTFPDLVDKTLCQVLHLTSSGRMFGHTLLSLALSTAVVGLIGGKKAARSWALGYAGHLLGDLGGPVPWFYPFVPYDFSRSPSGLWEILRRGLSDRKEMSIELALVAWAILALSWPAIQDRLLAAVATNLPPESKQMP